MPPRAMPPRAKGAAWKKGAEDCENNDEEGSVPFATAVFELAPPTEFDESVQAALTDVQGVVTQVFGAEAWVLPFGSLVQGVHLTGSDLDLCVDVPGVVPEVGSNGKPDNSKPVAALRKLIAKLPRSSFHVIETRFWKHIKVPIVILGYRGSSGEEVETDISVGVEFEGVQKGFTDRIIRRVLARTPRALHASRLIKLWAKVENLNKAYDGFLNSLGWTLLVVYFFMQRFEVTADMLEQEEENERGLDDGCTLPPALEAGSEDDVPSNEDMAEFFDMVADFESWPEPDEESSFALSVVEGLLVAVPRVKNQYSDQCDFFLEDPGIKMAVGRSENVARSLKKSPWQTTLNKCREAAETLRADFGASADAWVGTLIRKASASKAAKAALAKAQAGPPAVQPMRKRTWESAAAQAPPAKRARGIALQPGRIPAWQHGMGVGGGGIPAWQPAWGGGGGGGWAYKR